MVLIKHGIDISPVIPKFRLRNRYLILRSKFNSLRNENKSQKETIEKLQLEIELKDEMILFLKGNRKVSTH